MEYTFQFLRRIYMVFLCVSGISGTTRPTAITFSNNRYTGVVVAIHPDVPESPQLISEIKEMFAEASAYMYKATGQQAYFGDVTILVPETWESKPSWDTATSQLYSNADIVIKNSRTSSNKTRLSGANTQSYGRCGQVGVRINLFSDIFGNRSGKTYGPPGRLLVHQWAQFRWGVFDEYAEEGGPQFYFSPSTRKLEAVRCNINMEGTVTRINPTSGLSELCELVDPLTGVFDDSCVFSPYTTGQINNKITASIMDRQNIPSITHFCNDDSSDGSRIHNYESPSRHNRLCGSRSIWSVIAESPDFQGERNFGSDMPDTTPEFKVVRPSKVKSIVLVIDTSASMEANNKQTRAVQAATYFIEDGLDDGVFLGLVTFSTVAKVVSPITELTTVDSRRTISQKLPSSTDGETSIAAGLMAATQLVKNHENGSSGGFIVLITDGRGTTTPTLDDVRSAVKDSGSVINVIAFDVDEDRSLETLATETGGRYYYDTAEEMSTAVVDSMLDIYRFFNSESHQLPVQIVSETDYLPPFTTMAGSFKLDASLGKHTRVIITYTSASTPNITVTSPTGRRYCYLYPEYSNDPILKIVKISIPFLAEVGHWTYAIRNGDADSSSTVSIVVLSTGRDPNIPTLKFSGDILLENNTWPIRSVVVAEVTRNGMAAKDLTVRGIVNRPMAPPEIVQLFDNGAGADSVKGDGIYSRFFTRFSTSGHYSLNIEMMDALGEMLVVSDLYCEPSQIATGYASSVHIDHPSLSYSKPSDSTLVDEYPPMRITDLRVLHTCAANGTVVLAWTAPGDDLDYDKASSYSIVMSSSVEIIINGKELPIIDDSYVIKGSLHSPKLFGEKEEVTLKMTRQTGKKSSMVFTVFAVDDSGNKGELSNFVTVGFGYVADINTQEYLTQPVDASEPDEKAAPKNQKIVIACVVGFVVGLLVVTVVATTIIHIHSTNNKRQLVYNKFSTAKDSSV